MDVMEDKTYSNLKNKNARVLKEMRKKTGSASTPPPSPPPLFIIFFFFSYYYVSAYA